MAGSKPEKSGWQLEDDGAEAYERSLARAFEPWADRLLARAEVGAGERVLDVACGTGVVARRAATRVGASGTVRGLDLNEGMLAVARRVTAGIHPPIEWHMGDAGALPFPAESFDAVLCHQALQFLADRPRALREMHRVLAPEGRAAISVCRGVEHCPAYLTLADLLQRHVGDGAGAMMRSPFPAWSLEDLRTILAAAEWRDVNIRIVVESLRYPSPEEFLLQETASSPLAPLVRGLAGAARTALVRELAEAVGDYADDDGITFPLETWVAVLRR